MTRLTAPLAYPDAMTHEEWEARVQLAAFYRLVAHFGMSDLIYNHITLRVPGADQHILINPYGVLYEEITASSLHMIDLDGNLIRAGNAAPSYNAAGFVIHSAVHAAREDLVCVAHTHTPDGMAVSAMECGLLPLSQTALLFHDNLGYHDFEGFVLDDGERARLIADLGDHDNLILRNHGLMACGRTIGQAFYHLYQLEIACRTQVKAMAAGTMLHAISDSAIEKTVAVYRDMRGAAGAPTTFRASGEAEWEAAMRLAERLDAGFKD